MFDSHSLFNLDSSLPRERLKKYGSSILSDAELLSILLGTGYKGYSVNLISADILKKFAGYKGILKADIEELMSISGIGLAKATIIKASCEIGLRLHMNLEIEKSPVSTPKHIFDLLRKDLFAKEKEHLYLISLNSRMQLISYDLVSVGTVNETLIHPREIFHLALKKGAIFIILAHNHPSNDPSPSDADISVTNLIFKASELIGIKLIDHIIICDKTYTSLKEQGVLSINTKTERR